MKHHHYPNQRTPAENRGRVGGLADAQATILNLPACATRYDIEKALRGLYQQAERERVHQEVQQGHHRPQTRWNRLLSWLQKRP